MGYLSFAQPEELRDPLSLCHTHSAHNEHPRDLLSPAPALHTNVRRHGASLTHSGCAQHNMDWLETETLLRIGAFGCFWGHGFIAAYKLEFSGWVKFMEAAGFRESEAQIIMPLIGLKDLILAVITLLRPMELVSAWMVVWAFSTALVRPVSALAQGKAMNPLSSNAIWGFVERAANWVCPLAMLSMQKTEGYTPREFIPGVGSQLAFLDAHLNLPDKSLADYAQMMALCFLAVWALVPLLRSRTPEAKAKAK